MSDQEIAEKMVEIVDEFQRQTGMSDEVADNVVRHCFRSWINKRTMKLVKKKEAVANVQLV